MEGIRILKDETINVLRISSGTTTVLSKFDIDYDKGGDDHVEIIGTAAASTRTLELDETSWRASADGYITRAVSVFGSPVGSATKRGQLFIQALVHRGGSDGGATRGVIMQGYLYAGHIVTLGELTQPGPGGGEGNFRIIALTDPAAGNEYPTITVPTNAIWLVHSWTGVLVCGAAAANRIPGNDYNLLVSTVVGARASAKEFAIINETHDVCGALGAGDTGITEADTNGPIIFNIPEVYLLEGDGFAFVTQNFNALDDWGAGQAQVEEWLVI